MSSPFLSKGKKSALLKAAREASKRAYAPYSKFKVGAALLTERGGLFSGCNVENASYGLTVCAERSAVFQAVSQEGRNMRIRALAVVNENGKACVPCGACRQVIFEFGPDSAVLFQSTTGLEEMKASELLPKGFTGRKGARTKSTNLKK
ncbi:MAG: cytidine deaminase [Nitrospirota bacterium]